MMNKLKYITYIISIVAIIAINLSKFEYKVEIEELELIRIIGLDRINEGSKKEVKLTYLRNPSQETQIEEDEEATSEKSSGKKKEEEKILSVESPTYNAAMKDLFKYGEKIFVGDSIKYHIIGESTAKEGIFKEIDFLSRPYEFRLDSRIFIAKGMTAEEMLKQADVKLYEKLDNVIANVAEAVHVKHSLVDILKSLNSHDKTGTIPVLEITNITNKEEINISSYAIIKDGKLIDYLSNEQLISYNILKHAIKPVNIDLEDEEFGHISLRNI